MEQIERIKMMEQHLDTVTQVVRQLGTALDDYLAVQTTLRSLSVYYGSEQWQQDFADDEHGRLPHDLKRGVLSEDGVWNVLEDCRALNIRMLEAVAEIMKGA